MPLLETHDLVFLEHKFLFCKDAGIHEFFELLEELDDEIRGITPDQLCDVQVQKLLVSLYDELALRLLPEGGRKITLVTKTMMGIWGVFPSLDRYFINTFQRIAKSKGQRGVFSRFSANTVEFIGEFYAAHREELESLAARYQTVDFDSGQATEYEYPVAKIIDIYGVSAAFNS